MLRMHKMIWNFAVCIHHEGNMTLLTAQTCLTKRIEHDVARKLVAITKTRLFKYIEKITSKNRKKNQIKNSDISHVSVQNIDCGYSLEPPRRGGSNEYPLSMFLSRNKKNNVYPCKPKFYYIKVGFKGVNII